MSSFFGRLSGKKDKEPTTHVPTSASSTAEPQVTAEDLDIGSPADRGDEPELPMEDEGSGSGVQYSSLHQSLVHQRQGVLPSLTHRAWGAYTEDDLKGTKVRGPSYLSDSVKVPCGPPLYTLAHADVFYTNKAEPRITSTIHRPESFLASSAHSAFLASQPWTSDPAAATLVIQFTFPGPHSVNMNLVLFFHRRVPPADVLAQQSTDPTLAGVEPSRVRAFDTVLRRFRQGSDGYRDGKLKIIPRVAEGGYIVKKAIGRVPALLGKKLKSSYKFDETLNCLEVTADVGSSKVAGKILSLVKSTCKSLVVDLTFLLQGDAGDELPESVLGGVRIAHCDMDKIQYISENDAANGFTKAAV